MFAYKAMPTAVEMAKVALTSAITSSSGALVALLSFVAQVDLKTSAVCPVLFALGMLGLSLFAAVFSAIAAYLNELYFANEDSRSQITWHFAFWPAVVSVFALGLGLTCSMWAVVTQLG